MWEVNQALSENTHYVQLKDGRWKAEYKGFVTMTAEGDTPTESERQLNRAMDVLLAALLRGGKDRERPDVVHAISSFMLSDAIKVVRRTAIQTARFKQGQSPCSAEDSGGSTDRSPQRKGKKGDRRS